MKRYLGLVLGLLVLVAAPVVMAQENDTYNHGEAGVFADYFRFNRTDAHINFVGVGGRVGFNLHPNAQLEAEMAYDFSRNFTNTFSNGVTTDFVTSKFRTLHGYVGPKFQTSGPVRVFISGKVGFDNFSVTTASPGAGFRSVAGLDNGKTDFAVFPSGGVEFFGGPIGLRLEVGDDVYFAGGAHNNLRATVGPQFRF